MYQIIKKSDAQRHEEIQDFIEIHKKSGIKSEITLKRLFQLTGININDIIENFDIGEIHESINNERDLKLRNFMINEIFELFYEKDLRPSAIYKKLSYITGLSPDYLKQLRFNHQLA